MLKQITLRLWSIRYDHMDGYLVDIFYLSEAFGGARIGNCDIKPADGATIFEYLRKRGTSRID